MSTGPIIKMYFEFLLYSHWLKYATHNKDLSRTNNLSGSVANDLSGFMISLEVQGGVHETDEIATGAFDGTF